MTLIRPSRRDRYRTRIYLVLAVPASILIALGMRVLERLQTHNGFLDRRLYGYLSLGVLAVLVGYTVVRLSRSVEAGLAACGIAWVCCFAVAWQAGMLTGG